MKLLLVDDHAVVRAGLKSVFASEPDIEVVGEAGDGEEAVRKVLSLKPHVVLMDNFMPGRTGLEATVAIAQQAPETRVLIFTISDREDDLFQALRLGAQGYLLKGSTINEVVEAVRKTARGEAILSPKIAARLVAEYREKADEPKLSSREAEVLALLGEGHTNNEIADKLCISESTVRTYLHRLLEKLHLRNRAEAIAYAARHHLVGSQR